MVLWCDLVGINHGPRGSPKAKSVELATQKCLMEPAQEDSHVDRSLLASPFYSEQCMTPYQPQSTCTDGEWGRTQLGRLSSGKGTTAHIGLENRMDPGEMWVASWQGVSIAHWHPEARERIETASRRKTTAEYHHPCKGGSQTSRSRPNQSKPALVSGVGKRRSTRGGNSHKVAGGFPAQSVWNLMTRVGLRGHQRETAVHRLVHSCESLLPALV